MDHLLETLQQVQERLEGGRLQSAVIGGLAVAVWGEPRATRDVDLKVAATRQQLPEVLNSLGRDFPPAHPEAVDFARRTGILFVDSPAGIRVDLLLADVGFDLQAIERAVVTQVQPGVSARVCTPEDLIIYKLISTRPRDHADAQTVVRRQGPNLDHDYVESWLREFELALDDSTLLETYRSMRA